MLGEKMYAAPARASGQEAPRAAGHRSDLSDAHGKPRRKRAADGLYSDTHDASAVFSGWRPGLATLTFRSKSHRTEKRTAMAIHAGGGG